MGKETTEDGVNDRQPAGLPVNMCYVTSRIYSLSRGHFTDDFPSKLRFEGKLVLV